VSRLSYPALSVVLILPWIALGWGANVLCVLCLLAAMALVLVRAPAGTRPFVLTGLLAAFYVIQAAAEHGWRAAGALTVLALPAPAGRARPR